MAEIERENIRTQTMAGREQKAREGKWNGGFAPYGYKLENGELMLPRGYGKIINVASMQSFFGIPDTPAYAASKGAVAQLTKVLGNE